MDTDLSYDPSFATQKTAILYLHIVFNCDVRILNALHYCLRQYTFCTIPDVKYVSKDFAVVMEEILLRKWHDPQGLQDCRYYNASLESAWYSYKMSIDIMYFFHRHTENCNESVATLLACNDHDYWAIAVMRKPHGELIVVTQKNKDTLTETQFEKGNIYLLLEELIAQFVEIVEPLFC